MCVRVSGRVNLPSQFFKETLKDFDNLKTSKKHITSLLKKFPSGELNVTKNAHTLKACVRFSISIPFRFYQSLYFCSTKSMDYLISKRHNSFKN